MYSFYCILIVLPLYIDSPLSSIMGAYGYSLMPSLSIIAFIFLTINSHNKLKLNFESSFFPSLAYLVGINLASYIVWIVVGGSDALMGESVLGKSAKGLMFFVSAVMYIKVVSEFSSSIGVEKAVRPFLFALIVMVTTLVIELTQIPYALQVIHFDGIFPYWRPRLLTKEASWTASQIMIYGCMSIYYAWSVRNSKSLSLCVAVGILLLVGTTQSKSTLLVALLIAAGLLFVKSKIDIRWLLLLFGAVLVAVLFTPLIPTLINMIQNDLKDYTSIVTRAYTTLCSIAYMFKYPFGTGNALYLELYPAILADNLGLLTQISTNFNLSEISSYINATSDYGLSAKAGFFQYGLYWGIVGSVLFLGCYWKIIKEGCRAFNNDVVIAVLCFGTLISICLWDSIDYQYCLLAFLGLLMGISKYMTNAVDNCNILER